MCGIAGVINLSRERVEESEIEVMTEAIRHRGPDGDGAFLHENIGFGHRRLAIIDLSEAGRQPMASGDGRFVVTYNGEVYNFRELRAQLEDMGHSFNSATDTEVVLNSWIEWGSSCVKMFNGFFAFGILDTLKNQVALVRDRYGIKPLYYQVVGRRLLFGSEQKAIRAHPSSTGRLDKKALLEYFTFQNILTDRTLVEGIKIQQPGTILFIDAGGQQSIRQETYWDYKFESSVKDCDREAYREELKRLLEVAVKRQLVSDVAVGSYLSGGLDSGTLTALSSRNYKGLKTFTCGFNMSEISGLELGFDERSRAREISDVFGTEHHEIVLKSGDMINCLPNLVDHLEEPRVGQCYPNYYAAKLASQEVKVVLSGAGGDEMFAGYPWRYYRATGAKGFEDYIDQYYLYWQRLIPNKQIKKVFAPIWSEVKDVWTRDIFSEVFKNHENKLEGPGDFINHSLYFEAKTFLHGLFIVEDKMSMAHSLETRVPFLDNDLVDFALKCPLTYKLNNLGNVRRLNENDSGDKVEKYFRKTRDGKQILRDVTRSFLPPGISEGVKQGFSGPDSSWFKGSSIDYVRQRLLSKNAAIYQVMDRDAVTTLLDEHLSGCSNRRLLIWSLLNVEELLQNHIEI